jgi:hypothetical protein
MPIPRVSSANAITIVDRKQAERSLDGAVEITTKRPEVLLTECQRHDIRGLNLKRKSFYEKDLFGRP